MQKNDLICVTGASGMVGKAVCAALRRDGYNNILAPEHSELDLVNQAATAAYFARHNPDYIFHLAARVGGIYANNNHPAQFIYDNSMMQANIIQAAQNCRVKKLLLPGSACTYPKFAPSPIKESEFLNGAPEITNIAYAAAKINGIIMAQSFSREYGLKVVIPMPANAYGIGDNFNSESSHVIPALIRRFVAARAENLPEVVLWGSGKPLREFIYVDDVASAFIFLMQNYDSNAPINVGTAEEISIADLARKIAEIVEYKGKIVNDHNKPDGAPRKCLDSSALNSLGWRHSVSIEQGLRTTIKHYRASVNNNLSE